MKIHKWVIMETFLEVYGVENLDAVGLPDDAPLGIPQHLPILAPLGRPTLEKRPALNQNRTFGAGFVKINYRPVGEKILSNKIRKSSGSIAESDDFICELFD